MSRTITTVILTAITVFFGILNFDRVPVYFFWGKAVSIQLVFVIALSGAGGYLVRHLAGIKREGELRRRCKTIVSRNGRPRRKESDYSDYEEEEV
jgi:uncharacterized integral membrane protein